MLKKSFVPLCLLAFFSVIVSCQKDGSHSPYINNMTFDEKSEAEVAYKHTTVQCEDKSQCPAHIASLVMADESENQGYFFGSTTNYNIGFCSTQLIANNKVLTNRHCIPSSIAYEGADCSAKIMIKFPETNFHGAQDVRCQKVLSLSARYPDDEVSHPDWAIIELESSVNRPFPEKDISGLPNKTSFNIYPTYYTQSSVFLNNRDYDIGEGIIKKVNCETSMSHAMIIGYFHPQSNIFGGTCDHEVIGGNSGSGIYKDDGKLSGVISYAQKDSLKHLAFGNSSALVENKWAGGTSLSCLSEFNSDPGPFCDFETRDQFTNLLLYLVTVFINSVETSEETMALVENKTIEQPSVRWSVPNSNNFLDQYGRESFEEDLGELPVETRDLVLRYARYGDGEMLKQAFPFFPRCVHPRETSDTEFSLEIPIITSDRSNFEIDERGRLQVPGELKSLIYNFEYNLEEGRYIGRMQRLPESLVTRYREVRDEKFSSMDQCLALLVRSNTSSMECFRARRAESAFRMFQQRHSDRLMEMENEQALETFPRIETLSLPICEGE